MTDFAQAVRDAIEALKTPAPREIIAEQLQRALEDVVTNDELAGKIEKRLKLRPVSFGHTYREPHLLFADEAPIVLAALRTARLVNADRGE